MASRFAASILIASLVLNSAAVNLTLVSSARADAPDSTLLAKIDWKEVNRLKQTELKSYFYDRADSSAIQLLEADLDRAIDYAEMTGTIADAPLYRKWWNSRKKSILKPELAKTLGEQSVSETAGFFYAAYANQKGPQALGEAVRKADRNGFWDTRLGIGISVTGAAIGGAVVSALVFGPMSRIVNSATSSVVNPIVDKVDQLNASYIGPRMQWLPMWLNGPSVWSRLLRKIRPKKTEADALAGTATARADALPGTSFSENERYVESLYGALFPADAARKGVAMTLQKREARNTGFDLIYRGQLGSFGDRLQNAESAARSLKVYESTVFLPSLQKSFRGTPEALGKSVARFREIYNLQKDILTYDPTFFSRIDELNPEVAAIAQSWRDHGLSEDQIREIAENAADLWTYENRPAFIVQEYLEVERLYPELSTDLGKIKEAYSILLRQETAREINGVYEAMVKYRDKVEKLFALAGTQYSVLDRFNERTFPYGGLRRPLHTPPINACINIVHPKAK